MKVVPINPNRSGRVMQPKGDLYNTYLGPLKGSVDVSLRRSRCARLLKGIRKGWMPKLGLLRARKRGPAFRMEACTRLWTAIREAQAGR